MKKPYLSVNNLSFEYPDGFKALENITFQLFKNEHVAVLGPNGAGKTTFILHLNGILGKLDEEIEINNLKYSQENINKIRKTVGLVFQDPDDQLFMPTVLEDVMFGPKNFGYSPEEAEQKQLSFVDATCPLVSKVHRESEQLFKKGYDIILIGHNNHPEVIGTMGQLPKGSIKLVETVNDASLLDNKNFSKPLAYITQTTLSVDDTAEIISKLKERFPNIKQPIKEDICYATTNRQLAVKNIAPKCDMFFVIGSRNSSNSVRLVEVAKKAGCENSMLMHFEKEIPTEKLKNSEVIGISSGASAPEQLVQNLLNKVKKEREVTIEEVIVAEEKVVFKLPKELN